MTETESIMDVHVAGSHRIYWLSLGIHISSCKTPPNGLRESQQQIGTRDNESMHLSAENYRDWPKIEDSGFKACFHQVLPTSSSRRKRKKEVTLILSKVQMKSKFILQMQCFRHCMISKARSFSVYHCVKGPPAALEDYVYALKNETTFLAQQFSCSAWQNLA